MEITSDNEKLNNYEFKKFDELPIEYMFEFKETFEILKKNNLNKFLENELKNRFKYKNPDLLEITRFKNILEKFFSKQFWDIYVKANIEPKIFYSKFKLEIEEMNLKKNELDFGKILIHNPEEKKRIKYIQERIKLMSDKIIKLIINSYTTRFKEINDIK